MKQNHSFGRSLINPIPLYHECNIPIAQYSRDKHVHSPSAIPLYRPTIYADISK